MRGPQTVLFRPEEFPALAAMPSIDGQVLVTAKPGARVLAWTGRDYALLAAWRVGRGSVGLFASDNGALLAPHWADDDAGPLWDSLFAKLLPDDPPAQVFADLERGKGRIFVRLRDTAARAVPTGTWFRPGGEPAALPLEMTGPFEYSARIPDAGYGSHLFKVADASGVSSGPLAATSLLISPPSETVSLEAHPAPDPIPQEPPRTLPWSEPRIFRLLLILAVGFVVVDELFRAP